MTDANGLSNLALSRLWQGRWDEVIELTAPLVAAGVGRDEIQYSHVTVCAAARAMVQVGRASEALDVLEPWAAEVSRRGWQSLVEVNAYSRAFALHALGRPADAADLIAALPRPFTMTPTRLMALRTERLAGIGAAPAAAAELVAEWEELRWHLFPHYLSALVEQALREPSPASRRALLARIDEHPTPLVLGYGYQADLDRLRAEHGPAAPADLPVQPSADR